jgi:hypothetical protein
MSLQCCNIINNKKQFSVYDNNNLIIHEFHYKDCINLFLIDKSSIIFNVYNINKNLLGYLKIKSFLDVSRFYGVQFDFRLFCLIDGYYLYFNKEEDLKIEYLISNNTLSYMKYAQYDYSYNIFYYDKYAELFEYSGVNHLFDMYMLALKIENHTNVSNYYTNKWDCFYIFHINGIYSLRYKNFLENITLSFKIILRKIQKKYRKRYVNYIFDHIIIFFIKDLTMLIIKYLY